MKSNRKTRFIILVILGILFAFSPIIATNLSFITGNTNKYSEYFDGINFENENLKISKVSGKIHIVNNSGWVDFRNDGNCTGSGTYSDPYVIEDLVIDGGGSGSCILIENSEVYFRIENCTLYNFGEGIRLWNVSNSLVFDNNFSSGIWGIYLLYYSHNNTISGNTINCQEFGIRLLGYDNNILGNIINVSQPLGYSYGISISWGGSNNNLISGNTVYLARVGIHIDEGYNHIIMNNTINNSELKGLRLMRTNNITISENKMNDCGLSIECDPYASEVDRLSQLNSHHIDTTNLVNGKPLYYYVDIIGLGLADMTNAGQVILVDCTYSSISNLNTSFGSTGISLYYSNNNNITDNIASNNKLHGIYLYECDYNLISGNTARNNIFPETYPEPYGFYLSDSYYNTLYYNNLINNEYQGFSGGSNTWNSPRKIIYTYNGINYTNHLGNYWDDYTGNDANNDGIGDTPYSTGEVIDNYPLMDSIENYIIIEMLEPSEVSDGIIPGYNLFLLLGILSIGVIIISKRVKKSKNLI
jgi:parallel beta-helix repeat protein